MKKETNETNKEMTNLCEEMIKKMPITTKQKCLACLLVGMIIGALAMSLCWPKRIAKLKNGEEIVASVGKYSVSANEIYNSVKNEMSMMHALDLIDYAILLDMYGKTDEADIYAKEQSQLIYDDYEQFYGYTKEEFLSDNGYKDEASFLTYMNHDYYYSKYYNEYLLKQISDEEVQKFYNSFVSGKKKVHLYTLYDDSVDLNDIKKELDKGKSISKINEKYDGAIYNDLGEITFADYADYSNEFLANLYSLNTKGTSKVFKDGNIGKSLIYVESAEDKPNLEDIKDELKEMLAKRMEVDDNNLYYKAFIELREEKGLKIYDTDFKEIYDNYVKRIK